MAAPAMAKNMPSSARTNPVLPKGTATCSAGVPTIWGSIWRGANSTAALMRIDIASSDPSANPTIVVTRLMARSFLLQCSSTAPDE